MMTNDVTNDVTGCAPLVSQYTTVQWPLLENWTRSYRYVVLNLWPWTVGWLSLFTHMTDHFTVIYIYS